MACMRLRRGATRCVAARFPSGGPPPRSPSRRLTFVAWPPDAVFFSLVNRQRHPQPAADSAFDGGKVGSRQQGTAGPGGWVGVGQEVGVRRAGVGRGRHVESAAVPSEVSLLISSIRGRARGSACVAREWARTSWRVVHALSPAPICALDPCPIVRRQRRPGLRSVGPATPTKQIFFSLCARGPARSYLPSLRACPQAPSPTPDGQGERGAGWRVPHSGCPGKELVRRPAPARGWSVGTHTPALSFFSFFFARFERA